jgi:hypothetical protein
VRPDLPQPAGTASADVWQINFQIKELLAMKRYEWTLLLAISAMALAPSARAQEAEAADAAALAESAKKLANPVAAMISAPFQYNYDKFGGTNDGASRSTLVMQPVFPASLNDDWNLITRIVLPVIDQRDFPVAALNESGLGDTTASLFFSPKAPTADGLIWGAGPVFLLPTATQDVLGTEKWGLGLTGVALKQSGPWSVGILANQIWSVAGNDSRSDVNAAYLQPFVSYDFPTHTTIGVNSESTYDWTSNQWQVPVNFLVGQMLKIGPQIMQLAVGARYWAAAPDNGPEGWGYRAQLTFLFPK